MNGDGLLLENLLLFGRVLLNNGLDVNTRQMVVLLQALDQPLQVFEKARRVDHVFWYLSWWRLSRPALVLDGDFGIWIWRWYR